MTIKEFAERTGFEPTSAEYEEIERAYYDFDGDKDAFCKDFARTGGEKKIYQRRAEYIAELESQLTDSEKEHKAEIAKLRAELAKVREELDAELDWQFSVKTGTNMEQARYAELAKCGTVMTDDVACVFIAEECGFNVMKIRIRHEVSTYEINKHHQLRKSATFDRQPVFKATDWNYVRFDCGRWMYELVDGDLYFYSC